MKVLVVNDYDGHCRVFHYTKENLIECLEYLQKINYDFQATDEEVEEMLRKDASVEELEAFLNDWNSPVDRSGGGGLYFVEVEEYWNYVCGPWE